MQCPKCRGNMKQVTDIVFFDAGEFSGLTQHTAFAKAKQLFDTIKSNL